MRCIFSITRIIIPFLALYLCLAPTLLFAATCIGQVSGPQAEAVNWAVIMMFILIVSVLAAFASFFLYLWKKGREHPDYHVIDNNLFN